MKIVNIITQMEAAGAQQAAVNIADLLQHKGFEAQVWFLYMKRPSYEGKNVRVILNRKPSTIADYLYIFWSLIKLLRNYKPEVVITHTYYSNIMGQVAACLCGIRARLAVQHNPVYTYPKLARVLDCLIGSLGFYKRNIIVSKAVLNSLESYPGIYKKSIRVIYYGIPKIKASISKENARRKFGLPVEYPLLVNVGRLAAQKNQHLLLTILKLMPELRLAIAGEGELRAALEDKSLKLGLSDRVFLLGEIPPGEIGSFLSAGDIFVFPSIYEATGLAMVEAMQVGLPVIASDIPGIREVLEEEGSRAGILVHPKDERGFCRAIKDILEKRDLAYYLVERAKERSELYCVEQMVENYEQCFQAFLEK